MGPKRYAALLFTVAVFASTANSQWRRVDSGSLAWLHSIEFVDETTGWIGGSNGTLLHSTDGGETWRKENFPTTDNIRDIAFRGRLNGWILCERSQYQRPKGVSRSYLMETDDGGRSWKKSEFKATNEPLTRLLLTKNGDGRVIGEGGMISEFPARERAEKRFSLPVRYLMLDGAAFENGGLLLVGSGGTVIASDDGGVSWQEARFSGPRPSVRLSAVSFVNENRGWVVGDNGTIFRSMDAGRTWQSAVSGTSANLLDVWFNEAGVGFASGDDGIILRSLDTGRNWTLEQSGTKHRLERFGLAGRNLFAVGFGGTIIVRDISSGVRKGNREVDNK